jgi:hypothetical protein
MDSNLQAVSDVELSQSGYFLHHTLTEGLMICAVVYLSLGLGIIVIKIIILLD